MFDAIGEGHRIMHEGPKKEIDLDELERMTKKKPLCSDDIMAMLCAIPDLIAELKEARAENGELKRHSEWLERKLQLRIDNNAALVRRVQELESEKEAAKEDGE